MARKGTLAPHRTSYDGSPLAGQMTLFDEYNVGNGKRKKPKAIAVIVDHVTDENNDSAADIARRASSSPRQLDSRRIKE